MATIQTHCMFILFIKLVTFSLSSIYSCGGTAIIYFIRTDLGFIGKIKQASLKCSDEIRNKKSYLVLFYLLFSILQTRITWIEEKNFF